jgi:hypothetical protein
MVWFVPRLVLFKLVASPLQPGVMGPSPDTGCMVPQSFATGGNRSYLEFWGITSGPWYPRYNTPTVAPEPSIEGVARAGHSMVGEIIGLKPPRSRLGILWWCPSCSPLGCV